MFSCSSQIDGRKGFLSLEHGGVEKRLSHGGLTPWIAQLKAQLAKRLQDCRDRRRVLEMNQLIPHGIAPRPEADQTAVQSLRILQVRGIPGEASEDGDGALRVIARDDDQIGDGPDGRALGILELEEQPRFLGGGAITSSMPASPGFTLQVLREPRNP